jgi:hypothetical protein
MALARHALLILTFAFSASAQFDPGASMDLGAGYGQIALSQSILTGTRQTGAAAGASRPGKILRFYWRDSISHEFRQEMIDSLSAKFKLSKPAARKLLEDVNPLAGFQEVTHDNGLDMFDIADLLTTYCAVSWEIVHGRKPSAAGIQSLNQKIRDSIARQDPVLRDVKKLTDKEKQYWMESLAYGAMLNRESSQTLARKGESARLDKLRAFVAASGKQMGIDLENLKL